jgi:hypothetical protein
MNRIAFIAIIGSTFANIFSAEAADNLHCVPPHQKITGGLAANVPDVIEYADPLMSSGICVSIDQSKSITGLQCLVETKGSLYQCPDEHYCEPGLGLYHDVTRHMHVLGTTEVCIGYENTTRDKHILRLIVNTQ